MAEVKRTRLKRKECRAYTADQENKMLPSTPKKVYKGGKGVCRICAEETSAHHLTRIFSKSGKEKSLHHKIFRTCGLNVSEFELLPTTICLKCDRFINKMFDFQNNVQQQQIHLQQQTTVKRCAAFSPNQQSKPKKINIKNENYPVQKNCFQSKKSLQFTPLLNITNETDIKSNTKILPKELGKTKQPQNDFITEDQEKKIITALQTRTIDIIITTIKNNCPKLIDAIKQLATDEISTTCKNLCKKSGGSVLFEKNCDEMMFFKESNLWSEVTQYNPFLIDILTTVAGRKHIEHDLQIKLCFIYSILMQHRWHELSLMQRIYTVLVIEGGCSKQLQKRLNKVGYCLSPSSRDTLLKLIGGNFMSSAVQIVKSGFTLRGTTDNWDLKVLVNLRKSINNEDLHLLASNLIENRITFNHLPNDHPKENLRTISRCRFIPSRKEWEEYTKTSAVIVGRIMADFFTQFKFFKKVLPEHINHEYSEEMNKKSKIISMPIINANENNYQDCVVALRTFEFWIAEIYHKAGLLQDKPDVDDTIHIPEGPAMPGQTYGHVAHTENDPMRDMKIPFSGDQLTRVRFAGAKDLISGAHTPTDRLEHCGPFKPVMWHTKASLLQYCYGVLFSNESTNERGTLKFFKEKYNRKDATPAKVLNSYKSSEELFLSVGTSYIVVAAMKFFGMETMRDKPTKHEFPKNISHSSNDKKEGYFTQVTQLFIQEYILQKHQNIPDDEDYLKNYSLCISFLTVLVLQLKDAAKEGDGGRNLINQEILLFRF
ncbi:uncharacterized protein LOC130653781 [Hydractinia symbiolongicarpus]|uniref:uncharacterized protein LOC130653781 n=1 Tax=Hydractinia symbiolongicarpus TaxID=13093 RepID=UPI00254ABC9F|nr:uncharacterized protein LOC130653781 [Hydractinia symbiolongicarpus]